jgi:hypothetical protein
MYLLHQAFTVPLNRFSPDESVLVGFGFDLCPVNVFHIQADEAFGREKNYGLRKHLVDFLLHPVAETVDGNEIRFLISGKPDSYFARHAPVQFSDNTNGHIVTFFPIVDRMSHMANH